MKWYKQLSIHQRIGLKECSRVIVGVPFESLTGIFSFKEAISILKDKLITEGFEIPQ
jgi:hypothetical protein